MKIGLFLIGFLILQVTCIANKDSVPNIERSDKNTSCGGVSVDTATLIAKGKLFLDYDLRNYDVETQESDGKWLIIFSRKATGCCGGSPSVTVDRTDGRIIEVGNGK